MVSLVECSVFRSDSLIHKVTVGKDTLSIKKAVCCSEVGQIDGLANCKREHHPNEFSHRQSFVQNNTSFVGLTGIRISFVSVVQLFTTCSHFNTFPAQWWSGPKSLTAFNQMCLEVVLNVY